MPQVKRLPTACPFKSLDVLNLYSNKLSNKGSVSDKADSTFLKSPTAGMSNSSLNLQLKNHHHILIQQLIYQQEIPFSPLTKVEVPVPPPNITIFLLIKITFHINIIFYFIS